MSADSRERFAQLDGEAFARLVARTWRAYGRAIESDLPDGVGDLSTPIDGGRVLTARAADRRIVLTHPGGEQLAATALLAVLAEVESPEELRVVSAAGFDPGALSVGDAYGVDLVGPGALARLRDHQPDRAAP
ncbi:hypothetical protein B4589_016150 (plasmid) [Halolamina sp. CBA1230]|uniref:hypothetical protein n=1 Tax=Halolamina sp. CBA1230 TaxID=1853690 RepID=UPI00117AD9E1|nr:hypothetical protein [Halolamina sp. CBA1230]QKY21943.1 hypothetical protein B4589_016150 [Halolamina sp. CBA1230]